MVGEHAAAILGHSVLGQGRGVINCSGAVVGSTRLVQQSSICCTRTGSGPPGGTAEPKVVPIRQVHLTRLTIRVHASYSRPGVCCTRSGSGHPGGTPEPKVVPIRNVHLTRLTIRVHAAYSNPAFAVQELALATRVARPNQKLSRLGNGVNSAKHLMAVPNRDNFWFGRASRVARASSRTANAGLLYEVWTRPGFTPTPWPYMRRAHCN